MHTSIRIFKLQEHFAVFRAETLKKTDAALIYESYNLLQPAAKVKVRYIHTSARRTSKFNAENATFF